jgi:hypothetical protein
MTITTHNLATQILGKCIPQNKNYSGTLCFLPPKKLEETCGTYTKFRVGIWVETVQTTARNLPNTARNLPNTAEYSQNTAGMPNSGGRASQSWQYLAALCIPTIKAQDVTRVVVVVIVLFAHVHNNN